MSFNVRLPAAISNLMRSYKLTHSLNPNNISSVFVFKIIVGVNSIPECLTELSRDTYLLTYGVGAVSVRYQQQQQYAWVKCDLDNKIDYPQKKRENIFIGHEELLKLM